MKTQPYFLLLIFVAALLTSCTKDAEDTPTAASPVVFKATFDDPNELNGWSQSSGGQAVIDSSASLRIEFLVGTTRGAWIDHLELVKI
jgi:outer membrane biogenesis lipoprotein LolB